MKVAPQLRLLAFIVFLLLIALFVCEERYRSDGQMFQAVYGLLTGFSAILLNELRKEFGQPIPEDTQVKRKTITEEQTISPSPGTPKP